MSCIKQYRAEFDLLLENILKSQAEAGKPQTTINPKAIRDQANSADKPSPYYTVQVPTGHTVNTPFGPFTAPVGGVYRIGPLTTTKMPLDNMKLDGDGKWSPNATDDYYLDKFGGLQFNDGPATEVQCDHKWVDVGFQFSKIVCSECNAEKKGE